MRLVGAGVSKLVEDATPIDMFRQDEERREWLLKTVDKINLKYGTTVHIGCGV